MTLPEQPPPPEPVDAPEPAKAADAGSGTGPAEASEPSGARAADAGQADDAPEPTAAEDSGNTEAEGADAPTEASAPPEQTGAQDAASPGQTEDPSEVPESGDGTASDGSGEEAPDPWEAPSAASTTGDQHSSLHGEDTALPRGAADVSHAMRSDYIAPDDPKSRVPSSPKEAGDIMLSTGDHVYFEPHLTTIGYDQMTQLNREMTARMEGHHDIIVHGNDKGFFMPGRKNAAGVDFPPGEVSAGHIAEAIRNNPGYQGGPIRLISCHTGVLKEGEVGLPAAQALANEMKVPVTAPTHEVGIYPSRGKGQEPEVQNGGYWRTFLPLLD